jgi:hypothetical protein
MVVFSLQIKEVAPIEEIFARQQPLALTIPSKVAVVGCGGIGSWVALDLALVGTRELLLIDPDALEATNLNRTPYYLKQVGCLKVTALAELIANRRPECLVITYPFCLQEVQGLLPIDLDYFIDCTDNLHVKQAAASRWHKKYIKLGYDGFYFTIDKADALPWGEETGGYGTVPSFFGTPQTVAALVVSAITAGFKLPKETVTASLADLLNYLARKRR